MDGWMETDLSMQEAGLQLVMNEVMKSFFFFSNGGRSAALE